METAGHKKSPASATETNILACHPGKDDELVGLLAALNREASHHIGYLGEQEAEIRHDLSLFPQPLSGSFHLAYQNSRLCGALGLEMDHEVSRAWLYGPFCDAEDWQAVAVRLYQTALASIPADIRECEIYCDRRNRNCIQFAIQQGFQLFNECLLLSLKRCHVTGTRHAQISNYSPRYHEPLSRLHQSLFPNTYMTADQMLAWLCEDVELLVYAEENLLQGYIFFSYNVETGEGYFDFIGVAPPLQRRGIGGSLTLAAIRRCFAFPEINRIRCSISILNDQILRLVRKMGFMEERTMCVYRRQTGWPPAAAFQP